MPRLAQPQKKKLLQLQKMVNGYQKFVCSIREKAVRRRRGPAGCAEEALAHVNFTVAWGAELAVLTCVCPCWQRFFRRSSPYRCSTHPIAMPGCSSGPGAGHELCMPGQMMRRMCRYAVVFFVFVAFWLRASSKVRTGANYGDRGVS